MSNFPSVLLILMIFIRGRVKLKRNDRRKESIYARIAKFEMLH
jgi:hypothetical protein